MYASDKDRVSATIFPSILLGWIGSAHKNKPKDNPIVGDDPLADALRLLQEAEDLVFKDLDARSAIKLQRRIDRVAIAVFSSYKGDNMTKLFLATAYAMVDLTQQGRMVIADGSPLARAFDILIATMQEHAPDIMTNVDKSAAKAARKIVATLIKEGYF